MAATSLSGSSRIAATTTIRLSLPDPNFSLSRSLISYGHVALAPNQWDPSEEPNHPDENSVFSRPLRVNSDAAVSVRLWQDSKDKSLVIEHGDAIVRKNNGPRSAPKDDDDNNNNNNITSQVVAQIKRIIRYDADLSEFHQMSPEACKMQWGRTYCSPSLWEDVVKTITNCNMQWSGTCEMNVRLCTNLETPLNSFPTPKEIVQFTADELQSMCRLGYRSPWIRSIAQSIVDGSIDFDALEQDLLYGNATEKAAAEQRLKSLPGVGPFAKANILQLCGRTNAMPFDTETCRLWIEEHGASPDKKHRPKVMKDAEEYYRTNFPGQEWRAYWFDLWRNYESRRGMDSRRWTIPTGPHGEAAFSNAGTSSRKKKKNSNINRTEEEEEEVRKSSSDASVGSKRSVTPALSVALTTMTTSPSKRRRRTTRCVTVVTPPSRTSIRNKRRLQR